MKRIVLHIIGLMSLQLAVGQDGHMNLTGDAAEINGSRNNISLVDGSNETGGAWYPQKINLDSNLTIDVNVNFGGFGAEGFALVFQNAAPMPVGSGAELLGVPTGSSFIVEFDLQQNGSTTDALAPHTSFFKDGSLIHQSASLLQDVNLSTALNVNEILSIIWTPQNQTFVVKRAGCTNSDLTYTGDIKNTIFGGSSEVYLGFTAATSLASDLIVLQLDYKNHEVSKDTSICQGESVSLFNGHSALSTWSSSEPFDNTVMTSEIVAQPEVSSYYKATTVGSCGTKEDSVLVTVVDTAIVDASINYDFGLNSANIDADITGGTLPVTYVWTLPDQTLSNDEDLVAVGPGDYKLTVTSGNKCVVSKTITVEEVSVSEKDFFTPNGDGVDENIEITVEGESQIVNSGGQKIKIIFGGDIWDGTNDSGVLQPSGVYLVIGDSGVQTITLLR